MIIFHSNILNMSTFIDKFAEQLKQIIYVQIIILKLVHTIRKCIKFCTDRQTSDSNVTCHIFILQWIIKPWDTHSGTILFIVFCRKIKHTKARLCYVMLLPIIFVIKWFVSVWCFLVLNGTSFKQVIDVWNYLTCWNIRWHASVNCLVTLAFSLTATPEKGSNVKTIFHYYNTAKA